MNVFTKFLRWLKPPADPELERDADRGRDQRETIRTSQLSSSGGSNMPPLPEITDPRR